MPAQMPDRFQEIPDAPNSQENTVEDNHQVWLRLDNYGKEWIYEHNSSKNQWFQGSFFGNGSYGCVCKGKVVQYGQENQVISENENVVCKYFYLYNDKQKKYNGRDAKNCWRIHEAVFIDKIKPSNPNLAKFIGFLRIYEKNYDIGGIIFEHCGETLFETIGANYTNRTDWVILNQIKQLAGAIEYLHREFNLTHRDIKPNNILMPDGADGRIVLTDLGSARDPHEVIKDIGDNNARYRKSSDYYSFGLTVYYLTSRRVPYDKFEEKSGIVASTNKTLLMFLENRDWVTVPKDTGRMWLIVKDSEGESTFGDLVVHGQHPRPDFKHDRIPFCFPFVRDHIIEPCWKHNPDERLNMEGVINRIEQKFNSSARINKTAPLLPTAVKEKGNPAHLTLNTSNGRKHIILLFVPFPINGTLEKEKEICQGLDDWTSNYEFVCCIPDAIERNPARYSNATTFPFKILEDPSKELYRKFNMDSTPTGGGIAWINNDDILQFHDTLCSRSLTNLIQTMHQQPV